MAKEAPSKKQPKAPETKQYPTDRPMTGILTRDDGRRTEHNAHPLDPMYLGTPIAESQGLKDAMEARVEAGLEPPAKGNDEDTKAAA